MTISLETLQGYILEEVLAYLIRNAGYKLLVDYRQDPHELAQKGNGLVVKGRGAIHQVDVLGQLQWIPAFTFPLRLFVEAKFRGRKTGIDVVRHAVGVVTDVNQNNFPSRDKRALQKYNYAYAVFSTSGFSSTAADMALAHQISLIDLSTSEFVPLLNAIKQAAQRMILSSSQPAADEDVLDVRDATRSRFVADLRESLRQCLGTFPPELDSPLIVLDEELTEALRPAIQAARRFDELFVAMANGPYMLLLRADDPQAFIRFARENPSHNVTIHFNRLREDGEAWWIESANTRNGYRLSFNLPKPIAE